MVRLGHGRGKGERRGSPRLSGGWIDAGFLPKAFLTYLMNPARITPRGGSGV
jgi:hypothetical protein